MNGMGDIRVDVHSLLRDLGPQIDALAPGRAAPRRLAVPEDDVRAADRATRTSASRSTRG